jgi:hypothetical protein
MRDVALLCPAPTRRRLATTLLVWVGSLTTPAVAAASGSLTVDLLAGIDTNPLEVEDDGPNGAYAEMRIGAGATVPLGQRVGLRLGGTIAARAYDTSTADAGTETGYGRVGFDCVIGRIDRRTVVLGVGLLGAVDRSTFTDRATGRVYTVEAEPATLPPTLVAVPGRFDANTTGAFLDVDARLSHRVHAFLSSTLESTDFVEEYDARTALDSLDYRAWTVEPGLRLAVSRIAALRVSLAASALAYESQPALERNGAPAPGVDRAYRGADLRLALSVSPWARWAFDLGLRGGPRTDTYAGYYDLAALGTSLGATYRPSWRTRFEIVASSRAVEYDHAPVTTSTDGELRGSRVDRLTGRLDYDLYRPTTLFAESGVERASNNDALYTHDRSWLALGLRYRP